MRFVVFIMLGLFSLAAFSQTDVEPSYSFSFSSKQQNGLPLLTNETQFDCSNQIYAIVNASNLPDEPINSTIIWRNPANEIQEKTPVTLYPVDGKAFGWAWLKLHKTTGAALLSFIDDSIGMDEFIGDWQIELLVNNERVVKQSFNVLC